MNAEVCISTPADGLLAYIRNFGRLGFTDYDDLLAAGQFWTPARKPRTIPYGKIRHCFDNSYRAHERYGLRYCEGIAFSGLVPCHHAWNLDAAGNVVDVTWRTTGPKAKDPAALAYFGIEFSAHELDRILGRSGTYGAMFKPGGWTRHDRSS